MTEDDATKCRDLRPGPGPGDEELGVDGSMWSNSIPNTQMRGESRARTDKRPENNQSEKAQIVEMMRVQRSIELSRKRCYGRVSQQSNEEKDEEDLQKLLRNEQQVNVQYGVELVVIP